MNAINKKRHQTFISLYTDYQDPYITCPDNVEVDLSPGANEADVSALLQDPTSNQPPSRITITPAEYFKDKMFPAGTTFLNYVATNEVGKTAQCQTVIIVVGIHWAIYSFMSIHLILIYPLVLHWFIELFISSCISSFVYLSSHWCK